MKISVFGPRDLSTESFDVLMNWESTLAKLAAMKEVEKLDYCVLYTGAKGAQKAVVDLERQKGECAGLVHIPPAFNHMTSAEYNPEFYTAAKINVITQSDLVLIFVGDEEDPEVQEAEELVAKFDKSSLVFRTRPQSLSNKNDKELL